MSTNTHTFDCSLHPNCHVNDAGVHIPTNITTWRGVSVKATTKRRKQLVTVSKWLAKARPDIEKATATQGWQPEFSLLVAIEQLVVYLKLLEEEQ